jgi:hypothetical protein
MRPKSSAAIAAGLNFPERRAGTSTALEVDAVFKPERVPYEISKSRRRRPMFGRVWARSVVNAFAQFLYLDDKGLRRIR